MIVQSSPLHKLQHVLNASIAGKFCRFWRRHYPAITVMPGALWPGDFSRVTWLMKKWEYLRDLKKPLQYKEIKHLFETYPQLHTFAFLKDLRTLGDHKSRQCMRAMIQAWITHYPSALHPAWACDTMGARLAAFIQDFEFFGQSADDSFLDLFQKSMYEQFCILRTASLATDHITAKITGLTGYLLAALALDVPWGERQKRAYASLLSCLRGNLLKDGFVKAACPDAQLNLTAHMIELRNALRLGHKSKEAVDIQQLITRAVPPLRFFRHGDGKLSGLCGKSTFSSSMVERTLALSDVRGRHPQRSKDAGFERMQKKQNVLLLRTVFPSLSSSSDKEPFEKHRSKISEESPTEPTHHPLGHAGALSFEWSHGRQRILKYCDVLLEDAQGRTIQSFKAPTIHRAEEASHTFMDVQVNCHRLSHVREIYLAESIDLRVRENIHCPCDAYGALRLALSSKYTVHVQGPASAMILHNGKKCFHLRFFGIDQLTLQQHELVGLEDQVLYGLFELQSRQEKEIKWSLISID